MMHRSHYIKILIAVLLMIVAVGAIVLRSHDKPAPVTPPVVAPIATAPAPRPTPILVPKNIQGTVYHTVTIMSSDPHAELTAAVGADNVQTVLEINRIDTDNIKKGRVLIVPNSFADLSILSPFPATISAAIDIPKLMVVSLKIQAFAVYESGALVRWGGVNTGKQSTPTPAQLYFANWKGKSVVSTDDDSWVLPWYVNLDNMRGISMHQYSLPGYPASHACIRLFAQDAEWIYNWVDQWRVADDNETVLAHGTPVIVFGQYAYGSTSPWKKLATNPVATTISSDSLEQVVMSYKDAIAAPPQ